MEELAKIIDIVKSPRITPIQNFYEGGPADTKFSVLYCAIRDGKVKNDEEAAHLMYDCPPTDKRYQMLRKNLTDYLLSTVVQYDFSKLLPELPVALDECQRRLFAIQKLGAFGAQNIMILLAEKLLKDARLYHFTEIEISCLRNLRENAMLAANKSDFEKYDRELKSALERFRLEHEAEEYCQRIEIHFVGSAAQKENIGIEAEKYVQALEEVLKRHESDTLRMYYFRLKLLVLQIYARYSEAIEVCRTIEEYFKNQPVFASKTRQAEFAAVKMNCWLSLRDYSNVLAQGTETSAMYRAGGQNWLSIQGMMFLAAMHTGNYAQALNIYAGTVLRSEYGSLPAIQHEKWTLFGAYLWIAVNLLCPDKTLSLTWKEELSGNMDIQNIWRSMPGLGRDKEGYNISLLVAQLLYFIVHDDEEQYSLRRKLLLRYVKRNLPEGANLRTQYFIEMLRRSGKEKDEAMYQKLRTNPQTPEQFIEGLEVIPYEILWNEVLKKQKRNKVRSF